MKLAFGLIANGISCDYLVHISSHLRPVKMLLKDVNALV